MKISEAEALTLARSFTRQIASRHEAMKVEASAAFGMPVLPVLGVPAKPLAAAIRIVLIGQPTLTPTSVTAPEVFEAFGGLTGTAKIWRSFLDSGTLETLELEAKFPVVREIRAHLRNVSGSPLRSLGKLDRRIEKSEIKPEMRAAYLRGQGKAASELLDDRGELKDDTTVRADICFFVWLYWPEIRRLNSVTQLEKFFSEMRQERVTRKNLEKVCREIGLKFTGRGRPKNPFWRNLK